MKQLIDPFEELVLEVVADIGLRLNSYSFGEAFENYIEGLKPSLERYYPHSGHKATLDDLKMRFQYETALLHVITRILSYQAEINNELSFLPWPVFENKSCFSWYRLSDKLSIKVEHFAEELKGFSKLGLTLSQASGYIFDKTSKRHFGEFYTPLKIVEHLIDLSGFRPSDLLHGQKVADPACGGGIILTAVAEKVITYSIDNQVPSQYVLSALSQNLFGFDIQPFSIILSKTFLLNSCIPLFALDKAAGHRPIFPNIELFDPLPATKHFWEENGFNFIIGNPPFVSVKKNYLDYLDSYRDILYGHPNLYQLFLWWSVKSTAPNGVVSFLLPQSMLAGLYFKNLRRQLNNRIDILCITRMIDHEGIIGGVDQQMMAVSLKVPNNAPQRSNVTVRIARNGNDVTHTKPKSVAQSHIVQEKNGVLLWIVSDNNLDYAITERLEPKCVALANLKDYFYFGNGEYVWNQNKEFLLGIQENGSLPLISSASIEPFSIVFPSDGTHPSKKRSFSAKVDKGISTHSAPIILVQRTTPRKVGRRLVAGMPSGTFAKTHPVFYLENHVNFVKAVVENDEHLLLYGLMGWLNSDLINFVFQLRNGSTQVSVFELGLLPVNIEVVRDISDQAMLISNSKSESRQKKIRELNEALFDWTGLSKKHRTRISTVLDAKKASAK